MSTFALVHGAWHGGWCWERLTPELERRGHRVVTVDLPCDDPDALFDDYAAIVVDALDGTDGDVVVVGHSLGGQTIPLVAARRPVRRLVFLCALIAQPGASFVDQLRADPDMFVPGLRGRARAGRRAAGAPLGGLRRRADDDVRRLRRGRRARPRSTGCARRPRRRTSRRARSTAFPDVPATYLVAAEDRIISPAWSRRAAAERLGVEAIELPGSHSPYLARPAALADLLADQA